MRRTIPAHPMGIIQKRPRGMADTWPMADWYAAEWWRIRLSWLSGREDIGRFLKALR